MYVTKITELNTTNDYDNNTDLKTTIIYDNLTDYCTITENKLDIIIPTILLSIPCGLSF